MNKEEDAINAILKIAKETGLTKDDLIMECDCLYVYGKCRAQLAGFSSRQLWIAAQALGDKS